MDNSVKSIDPQKEETLKKKSKVKRIFNALSFLLLLFTIFIIGSATISNTKRGIPEVLGYSFLIVQTNSMEPEIKVNDLVIAKNTSFNKIEIGDDIIFINTIKSSPVYGQLIVHRVIQINYNGNVKVSYVTKGINNPTKDDGEVTSDNYRGKVATVNTTFGNFLKSATSSSWIIFLLIFVLLGGIILVESKNIYRLKLQQKAEKKELETEKLKQEILEEYNKNKNDETR